MNDIERDLKLDRSRELYKEYENWRRTGHDITYQEWLEINLVVERDNHKWMIGQYKFLVDDLKLQIAAKDGD